MNNRNFSWSWRVCDFPDGVKNYHPVAGYASKVYYINYIAICVVNIVLMICTISLNMTTIIAYWKSSQLRKKTSFFLVMLLSFVDLTSGMFGQSSFVLTLIKSLIGDPLECQVLKAVQLMMCSFPSLSIGTLFLLNIERYLNIVHPFFTRKNVTKGKLLKAAAVFWCFAIVISIPCQMFATRIANFITGIAILVVVLASIYFYTRIYFTSRKAAHECRSKHEMMSEARQLQDIKLAKSCAIVVCCTFLCLTPFAIVGFLMRTSHVLMTALYWAATVSFASSTLNSVIFFWRNPMLRKEARKIIMG